MLTPHTKTLLSFITFVTQIKYNLDSMEIFRGQTPKPVHGYASSLLATASYLFSTQRIMFFFSNYN